ncbi:MAG: acyltransferase [archaeon]
MGEYCIISKDAKIGRNVRIGNFVVVHPNVIIEDDCDIQERVSLGLPAISAVDVPCVVGRGTILHCGAIVMAGTKIGKGCRIGNYAVIREKNIIGDGTKIGMLVQIENSSTIGTRCLIVAGAHVTAYEKIEDDVFYGAHVVSTNDNCMGRGEVVLKGPLIKRGARIGSGATLLPGVVIGEDSVVGAGAVVTKDVSARKVALGVPAREIKDVPLESQKYPQKGS